MFWFTYEKNKKQQYSKTDLYIIVLMKTILQMEHF